MWTAATCSQSTQHFPLGAKSRLKCSILTIYYKNDDPILSDREYDSLYDELAALEQATGIVPSGSPTQQVSGEVLESLTQVTHSKPMLSAKTPPVSLFSKKEEKKWEKSRDKWL